MIPARPGARRALRRVEPENMMSPLKWDRLLETCHRWRADVALLAPGSPPVLCIERAWRPLQLDPLGPADVEAMAAELVGTQPGREADG